MSNFTRKRALVLPLIKMALETSYFLKCESAMVKSENTGKDQKMEPADIMTVTNLEGGEQGQIIVNSVLKSILEETYENDGYVGMCFEIIKHAKASGKKYHTFSLYEIDEPAQPAPKKAPAKKPAKPKK